MTAATRLNPVFRPIATQTLIESPTLPQPLRAPVASPYPNRAFLPGLGGRADKIDQPIVLSKSNGASPCPMRTFALGIVALLVSNVARLIHDLSVIPEGNFLRQNF